MYEITSTCVGVTPQPPQNKGSPHTSNLQIYKIRMGQNFKVITLFCVYLLDSVIHIPVLDSYDTSQYLPH